MTFSYNPNTYTADLSPQVVADAQAHALECFPNESCGAVIRDRYIRFENESTEPDHHFIITDPAWYVSYENDEVTCIVHSHNNCNYASVPDQAQQQELDIPSMIINVQDNVIKDCIVFGGKPAPLLDRPFFYGAFDCLALASDYLLATKGQPLQNPLREWEFWARAEPVFETDLANNTEIPLVAASIKDIQDGDVLFYNIGGTKYINHIGVSCGNGEVLHHFFNRISGTYPLTYFRKYLQPKTVRLQQ
jgi:proteasome lid subunit RPN8/RPN11